VTVNGNQTFCAKIRNQTMWTIFFMELGVWSACMSVECMCLKGWGRGTAGGEEAAANFL
jgi:hypothetical protein